jgi:hypothetical protein
LQKILRDLNLPASWGKNIPTNLTRRFANAGRAVMAPPSWAAKKAYPYLAAPGRYLRNKFYPGAAKAAASVAAPVVAAAAAPVVAAAAAPVAAPRGFFGRTFNRSRNLVLGTPKRQAERRLQRAERQLEAEVYSVKAAKALVNTKYGSAEEQAAAATKLTDAQKALEAAQGERNNAKVKYNSFPTKTVGGRSRKNRRNSRKNRTRRNNY